MNDIPSAQYDLEQIFPGAYPNYSLDNRTRRLLHNSVAAATSHAIVDLYRASWRKLCMGLIFPFIPVGLCLLLLGRVNAQVNCVSSCNLPPHTVVESDARETAAPCRELSGALRNCQIDDPEILKLPNAPSAVSLVAANNGVAIERRPRGSEVRDLLIESYSGRRPKTIDREFLILNGLLVIAAVADAESTLLCNSSRCREANPVFGSHPARQRIYGIGVPLTVFQIYLAYHYKRLSPARNGWKNGWKTFPIAFAAIHGLATANNFAGLRSVQ